MTIDHFTVVCLVTLPLNGNEAELTLFLYRPDCFYCANEVVLMLTSGMYIRKAERPVSKQAHLQPRLHNNCKMAY